MTTLESPSRIDDPILLPPEEATDPALRPSGINISSATVTQATAHLPEDQRILIRWLFAHVRSQNMQWSDISRAVELDSTTLHRVFNDTYRYPKTHATKASDRIPLDNICDKIAGYKRRSERSGKARNPDFVLTTVAKEINWLCERALRNHRMAFLFGDGQVGKTWGLTQFAAEHNGGQTTYFDFPPASGVQYMLKVFAKALFVPAQQGFDGLLDGIIAALDPSKLVLIDNVHRAFESYQKGSIVRCLNTLQYIYDQSGCGMVISATNTFRKQVQEGQFKNALKQLDRRGKSYVLSLPPAPPREDMDLIAERFGLDPAKGQAEEIALSIANHDGIGVYRLRLLDAQDYARNKKQDLNWDHFIKAYAITERAAGNR